MTPDEFLASFGKFGIHLGLERITQLLADLGNPHQRVPAIHVAGTNGKGSVCAYVSSILEMAGFRVGRYISPHLVDWRERICINDQWIASEDLLKALMQVKQAIQPQHPPTQFEVITAAAWWYFADRQVDVAVIETGLGGRLDATNVCDRPLVSVITSISMEHWQRLGSTLAAIASEKAGIIKPSCPVVIGELPPEAVAVMRDKVEANHCPVTWVHGATAINSTAFSSESTLDSSLENLAVWEGITYPLPLLGKHQLMNSAIALGTIQALRTQGWEIPESAVTEGMRRTQWLGRLQWVEYQQSSGGQKRTHKLLIDGAHNVAAAEYLREFVDRAFPNQPRRWVIGMLDTKDHLGILHALLHSQDRLITVPVPFHQTADPEMLAKLGATIVKEPPTAYPDLESGLDAAFCEYESQYYPVILCGSLYLIGQFLSKNG
ncbi:folylpolyglutamate synthase/dihydrofolate synthase family protein [Tumidithrix elongata RA019]|uniref:tetrahydrofolate synthase n=1 Tax=Tumidithrix elongata BACA0141 TaxID=2716417 RepID=A0AAW9PP41_9CYAN|nr:folylpolyglutamate synthase/dihydrofolate synthase family protein [Tumidithrix elongata RA019]